MLEKTKDVTLVASTLKLFFRELPQPIINEDLKNDLYSLSQAKPNGNQMHQVVKDQTSMVEYSVLGYLCRHLSKVAQEPRNKMTITNLATCFGQTLIGGSGNSEPRRPESMLVQMVETNAVIELLISHVDQIFL